MSQRINPEERIVQRSVGFNFRQIRFFNKYPEFKPDEYCRKAIDEEIRRLDKEFLSEDEKK